MLFLRFFFRFFFLFSFLSSSISATASASALCNISGLWNGDGPTPITVTLSDPPSGFLAACSAWPQPVPGTIGSGGQLYLQLEGGLVGLVTFGCSRIQWNDAPRSVWARPPPQPPTRVTVSNTQPRVDVNGEILRVQDGALAFFGSRYYLYGARYQCCPVAEQPQCYSPCGWRNATYAVYSSPDLQAWTLESDNILPVATDNTSQFFNGRTAYFEPAVIYSPQYDVQRKKKKKNKKRKKE
jgi:hypothetical protein